MTSWAYSGSDQNSNSFGPIDQGYYTTLPFFTPPTQDNPNGVPSSADNVPKQASAYLKSASNDIIYLWITQASISFQTSGLTAQSLRLREYFPRYLVQPKWSIDGIVPNSFEYQRLAEFVRQTHFDTLFPQTTSISQALPEFKIFPGNLQNGKGPHSPQVMRGYIDSFGRGAEKFKNAPTFSFTFIPIFSYGDLFLSTDYQGILKSQNQNYYPAGFNLNSYSQLGDGQVISNPNLNS